MSDKKLPDFDARRIDENSPQKQTPWNLIIIGTSVFVLGFLFLVFSLVQYFSTPQIVTLKPEPPTLAEELQKIYSEKADLRLNKSDLLVQEVGLVANLRKVRDDLKQTDKRILELTQDEIDLSLRAANSAGFSQSTD